MQQKTHDPIFLRPHFPDWPGIIGPDAAGAEIGAREIVVCLSPDRDEQPVTFTENLEALAGWLKKCGVATVAMESTGMYWIPLFQISAQHGIDQRLP